MELFRALAMEVSRDIPRIEWVGTQRVRVESHQGLMRFAPHTIELASALGRVVIYGKDMVVCSLTPEGAMVEGYIGRIAYEPMDSDTKSYALLGDQ